MRQSLQIYRALQVPGLTWRGYAYQIRLSNRLVLILPNQALTRGGFSTPARRAAPSSAYAPNSLAQYEHSFGVIAYRFRPCAWADFIQADDLTEQKLA